MNLLFPLRSISHRLLLGITLAATALSSQAFAESPIVLGDQKFYSKGSFIAYAAPWSTYSGAGKALKHGVDFLDEITVRPETFPANVEFTWHWPLVAAKESGVYGYNAVSFGSYDGGVPQTPIKPCRVKELGTLVETFRFDSARPVGDFNVLTELFLRKDPEGEKIAEIGFFLRAAQSAVEFVNAGQQLGTYTDASGRAWKVAVQPAPHGPYHMFLPEGEVLEGAIDFKAALEFLRGKGRLTGDEWFTGLAFGIEPIMGSGSIRLKNLAVDYK